MHTDASRRGRDPRSQLSVVLPVHDEEQTLPELHRRLVASIGSLNVSYEILYVDDGSTDGSLRLLHELARGQSVRVLALTRNFGHQAAIVAGLEHACGTAVITMDADLQDPPELIPDLVAAWRAGHDVVSARRTSRQGEAWLRRSAIKLYYRALRTIADHPVAVDVGDYRLLDRRALDVLVSMREREKYVRGLVSWAGFSHAEVSYDRPARFAGRSKFTYRRLLALALRGVMSSSTLPLRAVGAVGIALLLAGAGLGARALAMGGAVPTSLTVTATMVTIGGLQLTAIALVALYVGRILDEVRARPAYVVGWDSELDQTNASSARAVGA